MVNDEFGHEDLGQQLAALERMFAEEQRERRIASFPSDPTVSTSPEELREERQTLDIGKIKLVTIQFFNTEGLVDVQVKVDGERIVPSVDSDAEWVSKSDQISSYPLNLEVNDRVDLRVIVRNRDTKYEHKIPVDVIYTRRKR